MSIKINKDINSPDMQQELKKFRRKHFWHRLFFIFLLFIITGVSGSLAYFVYQVGAANVGLSLNIKTDDEIEPIAQDESSGSGYGGRFSLPLLPQVPPTDEAVDLITDTPPSSIVYVLNIGSSRNQTSANAGFTNISDQTVIPLIDSQRPIFWGSVVIPQALIRLELASEQKINTVIQADSQGNWLWQPLVDLNEGQHSIKISVFDDMGEELLSQGIYYFEIRSTQGEANNTAESHTPELVVDLETNEKKVDILFDVRVLIPETHRHIEPGEDLLAQIALINFTRAEGAQDVTLFYKIINSQGQEVLSQSETVAVATQFAFLKSFHTSMALEPGTYQLLVELPYGQGVAVSADSFEVGENPVMMLPGGTTIDASITFQGLVGLFLLFLFILYFEFRRLDTLGGILRPITEEDFKNLGYLS
jgi:hypothetical protein